MAKRPQPADYPKFTACFAPNRKCVQADTDGEVTITLVAPESEALAVIAAWAALKDQSFVVELKPV